MPRKTRREKFAAKLHKLSHPAKSVSTEIKQKEPLLEKVPEVKKQSIPIVKDPFEDKVREFFLFDLRKSLTIIIAVLILETALYFAAQSGLLKFMS